MARTGGEAKADKKLHGVEIDWTGHPIRDGHGYYGESENAPEPAKEGAFPPPNGPDDLSRRRFSPSEALKAELAKSEVSSVTYRDGAEVTEASPKPAKKPNSLKLMWERLRADPVAMAEWRRKTSERAKALWAKKKGKT